LTKATLDRYPALAAKFIPAWIQRVWFCHWRGGDLRAKILTCCGAALLCCLSLAGCASVDSLGPATPDEQKALISEAASASPNLQPGEKIKVTVFGEDRLSGEYQIDPGGNVSLPLAGTIKAAGLSQHELEVALTKKFQGEYLRDPKVTVEVSSFRPFYVMGEVAKPGEYPYAGGLNVLSALALAGGSTYRASLSSVMIQHAGDSGFKEYPMSSTIPILPGDLIRVPERYF
jgi:polysaccharide export outer membrane protein